MFVACLFTHCWWLVLTLLLACSRSVCGLFNRCVWLVHALLPACGLFTHSVVARSHAACNLFLCLSLFITCSHMLHVCGHRFREDESIAYQKTNFSSIEFTDVSEIKTACAGKGPLLLQRDVEQLVKAPLGQGSALPSVLKFSNHTAHNSLILTYELSTMLESAFTKAPEPSGQARQTRATRDARTSCLEQLRAQLRDEYKVGIEWKEVSARVILPSPSTEAPPPTPPPVEQSFDAAEPLPGTQSANVQAPAG